MKKLFMFGITVLFVVCITSCYPEGPEYVHEKDIALTHYDDQANFAFYTTFVMPDSVVFIQSDGDTARIEKKVSDRLIQLVKQNFTDRNYQLLTPEEAENQTPDFMVTITAFATPVFNYSTWGNYWGWYPGWSWFGWGGVWGGYYPWYPWYGGSYSYYAYDKGTLSIDMLDIKNADPETKHIPVLWSGVNTGILAGSTVYLCERLERGINQCFIQSPYLRTGIMTDPGNE